MVSKKVPRGEGKLELISIHLGENGREGLLAAQLGVWLVVSETSLSSGFPLGSF